MTLWKVWLTLEETEEYAEEVRANSITEAAESWLHQRRDWESIAEALVTVRATGAPQEWFAEVHAETEPRYRARLVRDPRKNT